MSIEDHTVSYSLEINVGPAYEDARRIQTIVFRLLNQMERGGLLPEQRAKTFRDLQRALMILNQIRLLIGLAQVAAGPIGWAMLGVSVIGTMATAGDFIMELEGR